MVPTENRKDRKTRLPGRFAPKLQPLGSLGGQLKGVQRLPQALPKPPRLGPPRRAGGEKGPWPPSAFPERQACDVWQDEAGEDARKSPKAFNSTASLAFRLERAARSGVGHDGGRFRRPFHHRPIYGHDQACLVVGEIPRPGRVASHEHGDIVDHAFLVHAMANHMDAVLTFAALGDIFPARLQVGDLVLHPPFQLRFLVHVLLVHVPPPV